MISPDEARERLHALIDAMPDDQVAMVWMTFQSMFRNEYDEEYDDEEEQAEPSDE